MFYCSVHYVILSEVVAGWTVLGPGLVRVFVWITSLRGVISANLVRGLGYRLGSSRSLLFLGSTFVL